LAFATALSAISQYPEEAQYIGEPHANGLLESATFEKVSATLTTDLHWANSGVSF
jgi:hypothetical protein